MTSLNQWYDQAISTDTYIESMEQHKDNLLHIYDHFTPPEDTTFFQQLSKKNLRVIALTEDWCGDAMLNIPILLRLAEKTNMSVRMLLRDQNLELMDQYLTNGKSRSIPIFIFIDQDGNEVAKWGPRAEKIQAFFDNAKENLPPNDTEDYEEKFREMLLFITRNFRENRDFWNDVYESLKQKLS
ncbi:Thiol-disulfide isomerase or thioredoxin [Oceanobacillus limi]|uniref:Thiol-disulfide isomerase or thioredoxin n=1 Tax=Oceanobacillus limi TaxID=930131 RepID=A0A1I0DN82_9BACI|nr:thioredoxin family protein [Oceanobacillus limi]SET33667.1 Thiol-disulfide isomerase or thioredoxin [Oceanobacillus limi]